MNVSFPASDHRVSRPRVAVVAAVNDDSVFQSNLGCSRLVTDEACAVLLQRGYESAGRAYDEALESLQGEADLVVFAHQDVYFPDGWTERLVAAISDIERSSPEWSVIGLFGAALDGTLCGRIWSSGLNRELGPKFVGPREVQSVDEAVIVLRVNSGVRFDARIPGYHLYGTDVVLSARARGQRAFVISNPVVHNSRRVAYLDRSYGRCYKFIQGKWRSQLPVVTTVMPVTRFGWPLLLRQARWYLNRKRQRADVPREGRQIAVTLGYDAAYFVTGAAQ